MSNCKCVKKWPWKRPSQAKLDEWRELEEDYLRVHGKLKRWFFHIFHMRSFKVDGSLRLPGMHRCATCFKTFWVSEV